MVDQFFTHSSAVPNYLPVAEIRKNAQKALQPEETPASKPLLESTEFLSAVLMFNRFKEFFDVGKFYLLRG
jgi:hypothetical protein